LTPLHAAVVLLTVKAFIADVQELPRNFRNGVIPPRASPTSKAATL